jgi:hypothetical protein
MGDEDESKSRRSLKDGTSEEGTSDLTISFLPTDKQPDLAHK